MKHLLIEIAGLPVRFELSDNHPFVHTPIKKYGQFISSKKPLISVSVDFKQGKQSPFKPALKLKNWILEMRRGDFICKLNLKIRKGFLEITPGIHSFDSFLRTLYSWLLIQNNGFLVHSAGAVINGKSYLFMGKSGSGKSTICRMFQKSEILSDELMPVRIVNGKTKIYPSPFWGQLGYRVEETIRWFPTGLVRQSADGRGDRVEGRGNNVSAGLPSRKEEGIELKKIFFLKKSEHNRLNAINKTDFYKRMLACVMNFSKSSGDAVKIMETLNKIINKTKFFEIEFSNRETNLLDFVI